MKTLKMQGGDAGKPSKALSCARSWRALPLRRINRSVAGPGTGPRNPRGGRRERAAAGMAAVPHPRVRWPLAKPRNAPLGHPCGGRAPPGLVRRLAVLIALLAWAGLSPAPVAAAAAGPSAADVFVHTRFQGAPIAEASVILDMNRNWAETGSPDAEDYVALTGADGLAQFSDVVAVGDVDNDGLPDAWELEHFGGRHYGPGDDPDHDGLDNLLELRSGRDPMTSDLQDWSPLKIHMSAASYQIGSADAGSILFVTPQQADQAAAAFYDVAGRRVSREINLLELAEGKSTFLPFEGSRLADGVYLLGIKSGEQLRAVKMTNIGHGLSGANLKRATQLEAINQGWASGELIDIAQKEANKTLADKIASQDINVVAIHPDYLTAVQAETIFEGANNFEINMVPIVGNVTTHGRTGDEIGNLIPGGQWVFTNTSSGEAYVASLDDLGNWSVALPDTIPSDRVMDVRFEGEGYRTKTFTFLKSDECSATGTEFTGVDVFGTTTGGTTTRETLTYEAGHVALTFSQASAANDTILYMIRAQGNHGVVKWTAPVRKPYNRLDDQVTGENIGDARKALQENALNFVASLDKLPGTIAHPFYESTLAIQEGNGYPADPNGWVVAQMRNDTNAGNIRGPPPADETFTYLVGWTESTANQNKLISELTEAMAMNDYSNGNNDIAFSSDQNNQITGLNHIGKRVLSVANTYLPGDFSIPASQFSAPEASVGGIKVRYTNSSKD